MKKLSLSILFLLSIIITGLNGVNAASYDMYEPTNTGIYANLTTCDISWTTVPITIKIPTSIDVGDTTARVEVETTSASITVKISEIELNGVYYPIDLDANNLTAVIDLPTLGNANTAGTDFILDIGHVKYSGCETGTSLGTHSNNTVEVLGAQSLTINLIDYDNVVEYNGSTLIEVIAVPVLPNTEYTFSFNDTSTLLWAIGTTRTGQEVIPQFSGTTNNGYLAETFTTGSSDTIIYISGWSGNITAYYALNAFNDLQLELGSVASDRVAYNSEVDTESPEYINPR